MTIIQNIKNLASDSLIYGVAGIATRLMGVLLTPLYTRVYSPEDYGVFGVINNAYSLIALLMIFSLDNSTARWFYDSDDYEKRKKVISTWFWFYLGLSSLVGAFFFFTAGYWSQFVSYQPDLAGDYIRILAVSLPVAVVTVVATKVLRFEKRPKSTVVLTFLQALTLIGFNVLFVLVLGMGLTGAFYAKLVAGVLMVPLALRYINQWIGRFRLLDLKLLKEMIRYSLPFIPASISIWMINLSAVFFLNGKVTDADLGLFQVAFTLAGFGGIVVNSFQQAWAPFAFSIIHQENAKETYGKILLVYLMVIGSMTLLISLFSLEALMIIATPSYYGAAAIASILVFSAMFSGLTNIADLGSAISKKTAPLGVVYSFSAVILVILNFFLIPRFGVIGAALAVSISQLISPIFVFYFSQKVYPIPYDFVRAAFFVGLIFIAGYAGYYFSSGLEVLESIAFKILAFLIFSGLSIWLFSREFFLAKSLIMSRFRG